MHQHRRGSSQARCDSLRRDLFQAELGSGDLKQLIPGLVRQAQMLDKVYQQRLNPTARSEKDDFCYFDTAALRAG